MRLPSVRRALGAALVPVLLVGFTACGNDDKAKDSSSSNPFAKSSEGETPSSPESSPTSEAPATTTEPGSEVEVDAFLDMLKAAQSSMTSAKLKATVSAAGTEMTMEGEGNFASDNPAMRISMEVPGGASAGMGSIEMLMVDNTMYMSIDGGNKYMKMDMSELGSMAGGQDLSQMDPNKSVEALRPGITSVTFVGQEQKAGTDAAHYKLNIDTAKVDTLSGQTGMPAELTYSMWIDGEGRMTAMDMDLGTAGTMNMEFTDWGVPVEVKAPDASKITEDGLGALGGLGGSAG